MNTQKDDSSFSHKIYKNDPILFNSYVGNKVKITLQDGNIHHGVVYTVDPVSESIVLLQLENSTSHRLKIILGHSVKNIEVISETKNSIPELFLSKAAKVSQAMITKRKNIVMQLLLENRFPVKEEGDVLQIEDTVSIEPPYYPENCACTNSIILSRIQGILRRVDDE